MRKNFLNLNVADIGAKKTVLNRKNFLTPLSPEKFVSPLPRAKNFEKIIVHVRNGPSPPITFLMVRPLYTVLVQVMPL